MQSWLQLFQQSIKEMNTAKNGLFQNFSQMQGEMSNMSGTKNIPDFKIEPPKYEQLSKEFGMDKLKTLSENTNLDQASKMPKSKELDSLLDENRLKSEVGRDDFEDIENYLDLSGSEKIIDGIDFDFDIPDLEISEN